MPTVLHCVTTAVPGSLVLYALVLVCAVCLCMYMPYVGVQVYVCVHSVVLMVCSGYFGNLFGIIFRKVKVYAGHFTYHFLDFFGVLVL